MKYRHCDGKLVLKVTDNREVISESLLIFSRALFLVRSVESIYITAVFAIVLDTVQSLDRIRFSISFLGFQVLC
jgi:hypothetical protein